MYQRMRPGRWWTARRRRFRRFRRVGKKHKARVPNRTYGFRESVVDIVFVVMPFADLGRPAIGVSLLKSAALQAGYTARIEYCNIALGDELGAELYQQISSSYPPDLVLGEWFFARDLFGDEIPDDEQYVNG